MTITRTPSLPGKARVLSALLLAACGSGALACERPAFDHAIPDGASATETEMAGAQAAVKSYVAAAQDYIKCVEDDGATNSSSLDRIRNNTIDDMEKVAAQFNRQLRSYRKSQ